jgi:hypothetical protein
MKFRNFRRTGRFDIPYFIFKKYRLYSPTECYQIWLEDEDGYIQVTRNTLSTVQTVHLLELLDLMRDHYHRTDFRIIQEDGTVLWG